jgi:hypothetical protein
MSHEVGKCRCIYSANESFVSVVCLHVTYERQYGIDIAC